MHRAYTQYQTLKLATVRIQQQYRAYQETKRIRGVYLEQRHSALVLQAAYRGMTMRRTLKKQHKAAIIIQSNYRRHRQQCSYRQMQWAARVIQARLGANQLSKSAVQQYCHVKNATVCIQKAFRKMKAVRCQKRHQAAVVLQRNFKMQRERRRYLALKAATVLLQRRYRSLVLARRQVQEYGSVRAAIVCLQSFCRGFKVRKEVKCMHAAARVIQASFRMHRARVTYQRLRYATVIIQRYYRTYVIVKRQQNSEMQKAATGVQDFDSDMKIEQEVAAMHIAATRIQSFYRMHVQHKRYRQMRWAVGTIQSAYRAAVVRRKTKKAHLAMVLSVSMFADCKNAVHLEATALQGLCSTEQCQKYKEAAVLIQRHYRSYLTMKRQRVDYLQTRRKIIIAQAAVRGFIERQRFCRMKRSIVKIQAFVRGCKARQLAIEMMAARDQRAVIPAWLHRSRTVKDDRAIEKAAHVIQRYKKAKQQRIWFLRMKASTVLIQRKWKATRAAKMARQKFLATKIAVQVIQSAYRRHCAKKLFQMTLVQRRQRLLLCFAAAVYHHLAAIRIQRAYRKHLHLRRVNLELSSVLYIQQWYRARKQRMRYLQYREKIIKIQRMARRWLKNRKKSTDVVQEHINPKTPSNGIIKFQALWRGYSWRKKTDTVETKALRDSLIIANKESKEEKKLCNRTALAIDRLLKYKHFSYILAALKELEVVTRLSPVCCENISQTEAVCTIFTLIRSCNRSVPCMDVITYSVQVLLNLSKYERTTEAVYAVEKSVETLLDLLQMYREKAGGKISEKGGSIFTKTCCLLALISKDSRRASEIRNNFRAVARLQTLFKLTVRKYQMDAQRLRAKDNSYAYKNGHCSIPVTPVRTKMVSRQRPAWILRKDNIQEIVNPLQAIEMVLDTLGISCS
ncbi:hypothetical protein JRQ81_014565 [Phrynocephalus forsythii]|uniref:Abnormal spindle-like microcephaly-associated protein n=1 Tax=Phrynocephalus forsythii TaxID=171643 RepID=A0A9Q1B3M4_9SAUR|nr:hypothetical protein JRQ81_014565 [Phrynocephalus forsythii]